MSGILPRLGEKEEWWSRAIGVNETVHMLCESMNCTYLGVWEDFVDSFKLYKKDGMRMNENGIEALKKEWMRV